MNASRIRVAIGLAIISLLLVGGAAVGIFPYTITGITNGQVLTWNSTSGRFEPGTPSGSGNVTNNGTLPDGVPMLGNGTTVIKAGPINLAGGSSYVTGNLPATNLGIITGGDASIAAGSGNIVLNTVNSNVGTFGDSTHVPQVTLNAKGLATAGSNVTIRAAAADGSTTGIAAFVAANFTATAGVIDIANTTVTAGSFGNNTTWVYATIDTKGRATAAGNVTLLGTANQITVTGGTNNATISIPSNAALPGTPTTTTVSSNTSSTAIATAAYVKPPAASLTGTGSVNIDCSTTNAFYATLTGNATYAFTNSYDNMNVTVIITGDASHTVTWTSVKWTGGAAPTQTLSQPDVYVFKRINSVTYGSVVQNMQ